METRQTTVLFSSTFSVLTVCNIHFWIWKYSKFIFLWSLFWFFLICKTPQFLAKSNRFGGQKLPIRRAHHTFLKRRHHEVTKNLYYALSTRRRQISIFISSKSWANISNTYIYIIYIIYTYIPYIHIYRHIYVYTYIHI